jgi:hypothetical protein
MEALLSSGIPDLDVDAFPFNLNLFLLEVYAQRIDVGLMELIPHVATN